MKKVFIIIVLATLSTSCIKSKIKIDAFVCDYREVSEVNLAQVDERCLQLGVQTSSPKGMSGIYRYKSSSDEAKLEYEKLKKKHNDTAYKRKLKGTRGVLEHNIFFMYTPDFTSINITSSKDFNSNYPANTSLNSIVRMMSLSCYPFILSGYTPFKSANYDDIYEKYTSSYLLYGYRYVHYYRYKDNASIMQPVDKMANEMLTQDWVLLGMYLGQDPQIGTSLNFFVSHLYFTELPDVAGDYDITVELVGDNGKTYTATTTMTFE